MAADKEDGRNCDLDEVYQHAKDCLDCLAEMVYLFDPDRDSFGRGGGLGLCENEVKGFSYLCHVFQKCIDAGPLPEALSSIHTAPLTRLGVIAPCVHQLAGLYRLFSAPCKNPREIRCFWGVHTSRARSYVVFDVTPCFHGGYGFGQEITCKVPLVLELVGNAVLRVCEAVRPRSTRDFSPYWGRNDLPRLDYDELENADRNAVSAAVRLAPLSPGEPGPLKQEDLDWLQAALFQEYTRARQLTQPAGKSGRPAAGESGQSVSPAATGNLREPMRNQVFISYSHKDKRWLEELQTHLKPHIRDGSMTEWSDLQIITGSKWFSEIQAALARTSVAVLLVTPNFLASDFIHEHELAPILKEAECGGVRIVWIPVEACAFTKTALKDYQAVIAPEKPLATMKKPNRHEAWVKICQEIEKAVKQE